jgi:hypothetical protein
MSQNKSLFLLNFSWVFVTAMRNCLTKRLWLSSTLWTLGKSKYPNLGFKTFWASCGTTGFQIRNAQLLVLKVVQNLKNSDIWNTSGAQYFRYSAFVKTNTNILWNRKTTFLWNFKVRCDIPGLLEVLSQFSGEQRLWKRDQGKKNSDPNSTLLLLNSQIIPQIPHW